MVPDDTPSTDDIASTDARSPGADSTASTDFLAPGDGTPADLVDVLVYGIVGGIAGSVLSFVPFATVLGGAVAGYLCGGRSSDALKAGAVAGYLCGGRSSDALKAGTVAGVVMTLPFVAVVFFLLFFPDSPERPRSSGLSRCS